jgi:DEAD/DEAH box helicase domain-containing protein
VKNPDYFFGRPPEHAYVQPDNLEILVNHLKCAAFELPLSPDETFGGVELAALCDRLEQAGYLHRSGEHWHWSSDAYPADTVSLRSVSSDNFVIVDTTGETEVIGEVDFPSALATVHPKAIYLHQGQQYHVDRLDFEERKAYVRRVDADYYTDAIRYTQVRVLESAAEARLVDSNSGVDLDAARSHGDVQVRSQVVGFKKIKFFTNENVGSGKLELPENEMHTTAFWLTLERALVESLPFPIRERQNGMFGLLYALESVATLLLMCDRRDLGTAIGEKSPPPSHEREPGADEDVSDEFETRASAAAAEVASDLAISAMADTEFFEPNLFLYDAYPGGIGFSDPLFRACDLLLARTRALIESCECESGCPSCVGPAGERGEKAKEAALAILSRLGAAKSDAVPTVL